MATTIILGELNKVKTLYSYPNNCNEICFLNQSLEETITKYLTDSLVRDGAKNTNIKVEIKNDIVEAIFSGINETIYQHSLNNYLEVGLEAFIASLELNKDKKWGYNWRYFLPHGLAMINHYTVQLLHFPPDYVLTRDQNYLTAHTTLRWAELLEVNGAKKNETDLYQNIIDIAPIAAPSNAGKQLEGIYSYYDTYIKGLLNLWLRKADGKIRPMVAFGGPVREWIKEKYNVSLKVLSLEKIKVQEDLLVNTLASNHPSFIYNAVDRLVDDPSTTEDERIGALMKIMQEDLIAARWQVKMGNDPNQNPATVLKEGKDFWSKKENQQTICQLTYRQALNKTEEEAKKLCSVLPKVVEKFDIEEITNLDQIVSSLRENIGALESQEIDKISYYNY